MSEFLPHTEYPFLQPFVDEWEEIRNEFLQISHDLRMYPLSKVHNNSWLLYHMVWTEKWLDEKKSTVPITARLIEQVPGLWSAAFSVLDSGCIIKPHTGVTSEVLRAHLGLICPKGPWIKVEGELYNWKEGEMIVFDDNKRHEAANPSDQRRVIFMKDFKK